ncbi:MAG: adenosylcobinamide-GDP ribazoletransferase [Deltaproteobacteria bacterium]|nr:adenosylcobinamide-GDP ribazoletransferase [Deltaproteobacteria bacterium]
MQTNPIHGLLSAFRTLTILSWPGRESKDLSSALPWFPVAGAVLGLFLYALTCLGMLLPFDPWHRGMAVGVLLAGVWLTRGLHLDGLADWADSIGSFSRERRLEIMKDSHIGAFGVMALILLLMTKWLAYERLLSSGSMVWILIIMAISRSMMVELITTLPYARTGDGMGRPFVEGASLRYRLISHIVCLLFCLPFGPMGFVLWGLALILTRIFRKRCQKGFGGITGDLLGTANEMVEVVLLFLCAYFKVLFSAFSVTF